MKLFKYSLLALAAAFTFSACDDDNKYVEGAQSPGAFFPKDNPELVELPQTGNSVDITIARTSLDDPSTYTITGEDESGLFTFPSTVTFGPQEHTTTITVTYDSDEIITDELYPATVTVEGASTYGPSSYSFDFVRKSPLIITKTSGLFYSDMWNGTPWELEEIEWGVSEGNKDAITVRLLDLWDNVAEIYIDLSEEAQYPDGTHPAYFNTVATGVGYEDSGVKYMMYWTMLVDFRTSIGYTLEETYQAYPEAQYGSNFNDKTGVISLVNTYTVPDLSATGWFNEQLESIHLAGYPDYSVEVEYTGLFVDPKGAMTANVNVSSGTDVKEVHVANVPTDNYSDALEGLENGSYEFQTIEGGQQNVQVQFPITEAGTYTVIAVSIDKDGETQLDAYQTYKINIGVDDPNKGWTSLGTGMFTDGVNAYFFRATPAQFTYDVEIQEKDDEPGVYRVVDIFGNSPVAGNNEYDGIGYFQFDCSDPSFPLADIQFVGWVDDWGELYYGNYEANLAANNPGVSAAQIKAFLLQNGIELSTFEDGVFTINNPMFKFTIEYPNLMYLPSDYPLIVTLPSAVQNSPLKVAGSASYIGSKSAREAKKAIRKPLLREYTR